MTNERVLREAIPCKDCFLSCSAAVSQRMSRPWHYFYNSYPCLHYWQSFVFNIRSCNFKKFKFFWSCLFKAPTFPVWPSSNIYVAFNCFSVGFSESSEVCIKVLDVGQFLGMTLGMGTVSASQEEFILLIGKAKMTRLEKTPMGAGTRVRVLGFK